MRPLPSLALIVGALLLTVPAYAEQGQGTAEADARVDDLNIGTHWYGAEIDKRDLIGKVVLVEIWGS